MNKLNVTGLVLESKGDMVLLRLGGLLDECNEAWVRRPRNMPEWAISGIHFKAQIPESVEYFRDLNKNPLALDKFEPTPGQFLSKEEMQSKLKRLSSEIK